MTGMRIEPEVSSAGIVLRGTFNPAILTPAWFAMHGLLPGAHETATLNVAHPHLTAFATEWVSIQATTDQFQADTQQGPHVRLRDLVLRTFRELLHHTPVGAFGINREIHFRAASAEAQQRVGRMLAPPEPWEGIAGILRLTDDSSGMVSLTMRQTELTNRPHGGHIDVTVQPSARVGDGRKGIYVRVNDHYDVRDSTPGGAAHVLDLLEQRFDESLRRADEIVDHVMSLAT